MTELIQGLVHDDIENIVTPEKLQPLLQHKRWRVARGGRGGGKSWWAVDYCLALSRKCRIRVVAAREIQKSIKASVYQLFVDRIAHYNLEAEYEVLKTGIVCRATGSEFLFVGLRDHNVDSIKSLEGADILLLEEAQNLSQRSLDIAIPTIRKPGSCIIALYNPYLDSDPIHLLTNKLMKYKPNRITCVEINVEDNPFASDELLEERDLAYAMDPVKASNIWGGKTKQIIDGAIYGTDYALAVTQARISNAVIYHEEARQIVAFDLGRNDYTHVICGQIIGSGSAIERQIHTAYQNCFQHFSHYIAFLRDKRIRVDHIVLPHDSKAKTISTIQTPYDMCKQAFPDATIQVLKAESIELGIQHTRNVFKTLYMHAENAQPLLHCVQRYHRKPTGLLDTNSNPIYGDPVHDEASHGADCLRYWCQADMTSLKKLDTKSLMTRAQDVKGINVFNLGN